MDEPPVLDLRDASATRSEVAGAKAANLAEGVAAGCTVLPGFVLTTAGAARVGDPAVRSAIRGAWARLTGDGGGDDVPLVVRSSSTIEDAAESSMAGRFTSVLDVVGLPALDDAVGAVLASASDVRDDHGERRPMAVLVQRQVDASVGGVLFGVDPVTGSRRHLTVDAVPSRPDALVGGTAIAAHYVLTRRGRVVDRVHPEGAPPLSASLRRRLAALSRRLTRHFGAPQDVEWAVDGDGRLWLLQSRPVTAVAEAGGVGPVLGPGPVAETFPHPLSRLEEDLWVEPLRRGLGRALELTGTAGRRHLRRSPVVTTVGGRVAVDLDLLGLTQGHEPLVHRINPAVLVRHLAVAWRVGRARVALPSLAATVLDAVDDHLGRIAALDGLDDATLADLLVAARRELATVHTYEVLAGTLLAAPGAAADRSPSTAAVALHALWAGRDRGWGDGEIVERDPVVLALTAPSLLPTPLPPLEHPPVLATGTGPPGLGDLGLRDALRLRSRWLQELLARVAAELGRRLGDAGRLADPTDVRHLGVDELVEAGRGGPLPTDLGGRRDATGPPLPSRFRLAPSGEPVPCPDEAIPSGAGIPAGGGRGEGVVRHRLGPGAPHQGSVLVVAHLEPDLAPLLPDLAGLVSETGSPLSHLAILAREQGVPTVVGVPDARRRFRPGRHLVVDGRTGEVRPVEDPAGVGP